MSKERQTATCSASFGCAWSLGARLPYDSPTNGPWTCLEVLAGSTATSIPTMVRGDQVLCHRARGFGRDTHGVVREKGNTRLASQISRINTSDQWGWQMSQPDRPHIRELVAFTKYIYPRTPALLLFDDNFTLTYHFHKFAMIKQSNIDI